MEQAASASKGQRLSWDDGPAYELSIAVGKSARYHHAMSDFYARAHDAALAITALTGTSAFAALLPAGSTGASASAITLAKWLTAMVAVATTADLVFNPSKKADVHKRLHHRFVDLTAEMAIANPEDEQLRRFTVQRLKIEADEPPVRRLIDIRAQNDECRSRGVPFSQLEPLGFFQRSPAAYLFDFNLHAIGKRKAQRELHVAKRLEAKSAA